MIRHKYLLELIFGNTLAHSRRRTYTAGHHLQKIVDVVCSTPLLMRKHIDLVLRFWFLDDFAVRPHSLLSICLGECVGHKSALVQTGERDELPAVTQFGQALDVGFLLVTWHGGFPVERGREIIRQSINIVSMDDENRSEGTYFCSGHTAWTPSANCFACAKSGSFDSIQIMSQ